MRRKHLDMNKIYAVGLAALFAFTFVPEAIACNEPDLLTRHRLNHKILLCQSFEEQQVAVNGGAPSTRRSAKKKSPYSK